MEAVLNIYKPQGMTPLQALDAIRVEYSEYRGEKMTYAGRLDPMAEGVLIVLIGDAVHEKEKYLVLDKIYEADIILGLGTDTHDLLGMAKVHNKIDMDDGRVAKELKKMQGDFEYSFPVYSSKPVNGKPLFQWAREGRLEEIDMPKRKMCVYKVELLDRCAVTGKEIKNAIELGIANVRGDFRQEEITNRWGAVLDDTDNEVAFPMIRVRIHCASGTYVRTLAHELGKRLGSDTVLRRLVRTKVGDFTSITALPVKAVR